VTKSESAANESSNRAALVYCVRPQHGAGPIQLLRPEFGERTPHEPVIDDLKITIQGCRPADEPCVQPPDAAMDGVRQLGHDADRLSVVERDHDPRSLIIDP